MSAVHHLLLLLNLPATCGLNVTARRYVLAENSSTFLTEQDNRHVSETLSIDPHRTALVLIDVWDDSKSPGLSENENTRLLPLLHVARSLGMLIIHAPSEAPEWPAIDVLPGEILVTGVDGRPGSASRCDAPILSSSRGIQHVLMAGYDTNKCIIDKPCGAVALSTELAGRASLALVRDATRGEFGWYGNAWFGQMATTEMLELGWWLPAPQRGIPSVLLADLLVAAGAAANASALPNLTYPAPSADVTPRVDFATPPPLLQGARGAAALVVVSCSSDYANQGFRARVKENRARHLSPLLAAWRARAPAGITHVIHAPNGHSPDGACAPLAGEDVVHTNDEFDKVVAANDIGALYYVGYAANTDMLFGAGGMQRFYSNARYLAQSPPAYFWVDEATLGLESEATLVDGWAKRAAMGYRQPLLRASRPYLANVVTATARALCDAAPRGGPVLYRLEGEVTLQSATDAIEVDDVSGMCGPSLVGQPSITIELDAAPAQVGGPGAPPDSKLLCLVKSVGTPFAAYQLKMDGGSGALLYQTASAAAWSGTLATPPRFFAAPNASVRVTVVHSGTDVAIYRDGVLVANASGFAALDYSYTRALLVGKRHDAEAWSGTLGNVLIRNGSWPPRAVSRLPAAELAALHDLHASCGGERWRYNLSTISAPTPSAVARRVDASGGGGGGGGRRRPVCERLVRRALRRQRHPRAPALPEHALLGQRARLRASRVDWRPGQPRAPLHEQRPHAVVAARGNPHVARPPLAAQVPLLLAQQPLRVDSDRAAAAHEPRGLPDALQPTLGASNRLCAAHSAAQRLVRHQRRPHRLARPASTRSARCRTSPSCRPRTTRCCAAPCRRPSARSTATPPTRASTAAPRCRPAAAGSRRAARLHRRRRRRRPRWGSASRSNFDLWVMGLVAR